MAGRPRSRSKRAKKNPTSNRDYALALIREQAPPGRLFSQRDRMELLAGALEYAFSEFTDEGHGAYTKLRKEIISEILRIPTYD